MKIIPYFPAHDVPLKDKWVRLRGVALGVGLSPKAKEKLEWIIFYHTFGKENAKATAKYFGITRKTIHKWLKRFDEKNLLSLEEKSKSPITKREWEVTRLQEERIIALRKAHIKWGKSKLKRLYFKSHKETISTWKIECVIRVHKLFPDPVKHIKSVKNKAKAKQKLSIYDVVKKQKFGFLWHIDAIIVWWYGTRRVIFTAIEDTTKIAFARIYTTNNSGFAGDFLKRLMYLAVGRIHIMHSDNGSEFIIRVVEYSYV